MKLKDSLRSTLSHLDELFCTALVLGIFGVLLSLFLPSKEQMMKKYDCPPPSYEIIVNNIEELKARLSEIESAITNGTSDLHPLYAQLVSTNLVRIPCTCGYCRPSEGIAVPEHINQIGYDLKVEISTSYYPVVSLPTH